MTRALAEAVSFLFVPANRPERHAKAVASGADAVILDLEDSVPAAEKAPARQAVRGGWSGLASSAIPIVIRVNARGSGLLDDDLEALRGLTPVPAIMLSKAETAADIARVRGVLEGAAVIPLLETAAGLHAIDAVASSPGVVRLAIGHLDFMADTGLRAGPGEPELSPLRFAVAMATRIAGLAPAVDGVTVQTDDAAQLKEDIARARRFGFGGKLLIHPRQVPVAHEAFAPDAAELAWAERVVAADAAAGGRAVQVDGRMVDLPVVSLARLTLARARRR
ncbi:MAG TPA: CoA ester lyase [Usitatibacter sp.]|jgi:citrate lyase subunit beta/citryl-CoA lyase|nr:CoA ester lyase [Usitatibacter sp.]